MMNLEHRMLPGSHERPNGPECKCGAEWDYWNNLCTAVPPNTDKESPNA